MADDLIKQIGEENSALRQQATQAILEGLAQYNYTSEEISGAVDFAVGYGAVLTSLATTIAEVADKKGAGLPLTLTVKFFFAGQFTSLEVALDGVGDDSWREACVKGMGGLFAGIVAETTTGAALGTLTVAGSGVFATSLGVIGTVAAGYFAADMVSDAIGTVWDYYVGPKVKGSWNEDDNSAEFTVFGNFSDALRNKWDSMDAEADGGAINLNLNNLSKWTMLSAHPQQEKLKLIYENSTNTFTFLQASTDYIVYSLRDIGQSSADRVQLVPEILRHHDGDFNVVIDTGASHLVHNYIGLDRDALQQLVSSGQNKQAFWAVQNLTAFVEEAMDDYDSIDPTDFSEQYRTDRATFLYHLIHSEMISPTSEDIDFKDLTLDKTAYAGNGLIDLPINAKYIFGTTGGDTISGSSFADRADHLYGMDGNDSLIGNGDDDYLEGGKGQDTLNGGSGNDTFFIMGEDTAYDTFTGGEGTDTILGSTGDDTIRPHDFQGENTVEIINGGGGTDIIAGTDGADTIDLSATTLTGIARIEGGAGADIIKGSNAADILYGGSLDNPEDSSQDRLEGGAGVDEYHVGRGDSIEDSDNQGTIWFNGQQLSSMVFKQQNENGNYYENDDNSWRGVLNGDGSLNISQGENPFFFTIKNFASGSYGITLADYTPQETDFTFSGTSAKSTGMVQLRQDSDGDHWYYRFFRRQADGTTTVDDRDFTLANIPSLDVTGSDGRDFLYGLTKSDILRGGRTDVLAANNGADDYYWRLAA